MYKWVTILTFEYQHELLVLRARLEAEGIQCNVPNERTVQMQPHFATALGGVRLQVLEKDISLANEILIEGGYKLEKELLDNAIVIAVNNWNEKNYRLGEKSISLKQIILTLAVIILSLITYLTIQSMPSKASKLINNNWCLRKAKFGSEELTAYTIAGDYIKIRGIGCDEKITFLENGQVIFPGMNTPQIHGLWILAGDSLKVINVDALKEIYQHTFHLEFNWDQMILTSKETIITCSFKD